MGSASPCGCVSMAVAPSYAVRPLCHYPHLPLADSLYSAESVRLCNTAHWGVVGFVRQPFSYSPKNCQTTPHLDRPVMANPYSDSQNLVGGDTGKHPTTLRTLW